MKTRLERNLLPVLPARAELFRVTGQIPTQIVNHGADAWRVLEIGMDDEAKVADFAR